MSEKRRAKCGVLAQTTNTISDLPDNVIESILMHLPTRDAVRTSVLSRKWRYRWAKLPQLILDETLWSELRIEHSARITLARILCPLLLLREGPINKFCLSIPELEICPEIDNLIVFLSRNGVEDFSLVMQTDEDYKLPKSFYKCHQLRHLNLASCLMEPTREFKGFSRLITLELHDVVISAEILGCLVSNSPFLEHLVLTSNNRDLDLDINAPKLKTFAFKGKLRSLALKNTPLLASVSIVGTAGSWPDRDVDGLVQLCHLHKLFGGLPALKHLSLNNDFLKVCRCTGTQAATNCLKTLKLSDLDVADLLALQPALFLIMSSLNLTHLDVQLRSRTYSQESSNMVSFLWAILWWQSGNYSSVKLKGVEQVKLQNFTGTWLELELVKYLLVKSTSLKEMLIQHINKTAEEECRVLKQVTTFVRASAEAQVFYEAWRN